MSDDEVDADNSLLRRQNTYTVSKMETLQSNATLVSQNVFSETLHTVKYKYEEPVYKEPDDTLGEEETKDDLKPEVKKKEDEYVTAEEVRIQKHKLQSVQSSSVMTTVTQHQERSQEPTLMEETSLSSIAVARKQSKSEEKTDDAMSKSEEKTEDAMSRTSREVEQLINEIRDPNLDCSLDDIAAMIDGDEAAEKKPSSRGSPEFRTAATMIDQVC